MKTVIGQSKYRNLTLFHVVWSVPAKVFLTVTFSIWSILTDYDLFGSDVEQDWSYTVFALFFFSFCTLIQHCLTVSITSPRHSISFVLKKGPATPPTHHTLFLDQTESFWNRTPLPLGLDDRTLPLYEGLDPSLLTSCQWMLWETTMTRSWQFERRGFDLEPVKLKYAFILNLTPAIFTHKLI